MARDISREPMLDMFIFETTQLIEQLEHKILSSEKSHMTEESINQIFRIMHTIKGSSSMMMFDNIASLAHSIEDLFYYIREEKPQNTDYTRITDIVLESIDFIKAEILSIENDGVNQRDPSKLIEVIKGHLSNLKQLNSVSTNPDKKSQEITVNQKANSSPERLPLNNSKHKYKAVIFFEDGCEMENLRAFSIIQSLNEIAEDMVFYPEDICENDQSSEVIRCEGFEVSFHTHKGLDEINLLFHKVPLIRDITINEIAGESTEIKKQVEIILDEGETNTPSKSRNYEPSSIKQQIISVNVAKLDKLMDLVGELVISEAMVTRNPDLVGLTLDNFQKASGQLRKITSEIQDIVMSVRMVPLSTTFLKMNRLVRDMSKKLEKSVDLEIIGEETEVDKNIIERISDPLMHVIRNSLDHGLETSDERLVKGKPASGKIILEAKNSGGDVWIIIRDDGKGLDRQKILKKALQSGLTNKSESELTDREIYSFIFLPGFSTKDDVTEFSGRGVGMDVVSKNIEKIGGSVSVDSTPGSGTTVSIKIPLTLAIIDGMVIRVGNARYTVPTTSIKESFRIREEDVIYDPDGNEMILIRGECHPIMRLHERFKVNSSTKVLSEGIIMMVENESKSLCLFADELLGEQQVVVKALPSYIKRIKGIAGCTLLGDGGISLILDAAGLINQ